MPDLSWGSVVALLFYRETLEVIRAALLVGLTHRTAAKKHLRTLTRRIMLIGGYAFAAVLLVHALFF